MVIILYPLFDDRVAVSVVVVVPAQRTVFQADGASNLLPLHCAPAREEYRQG